MLPSPGEDDTRIGDKLNILRVTGTRRFKPRRGCPGRRTGSKAGRTGNQPAIVKWPPTAQTTPALFSRYTAPSLELF